MLCAAGTALTVSRGIGEGKVSGTKEGVAVVTSLVGRAAVPWLDVERIPVLTGDETAKGSVVLVLVRQRRRQRFDRFRGD